MPHRIKVGRAVDRLPLIDENAIFVPDKTRSKIIEYLHTYKWPFLHFSLALTTLGGGVTLIYLNKKENMNIQFLTFGLLGMAGCFCCSGFFSFCKTIVYRQLNDMPE